MTFDEFKYSGDIPGAITSISLGVNKLFFIYENYLRIEISLSTFLEEYSV
jgi:hypothetical protein